MLAYHQFNPIQSPDNYHVRRAFPMKPCRASMILSRKSLRRLQARIANKMTLTTPHSKTEFNRAVPCLCRHGHPQGAVQAPAILVSVRGHEPQHALLLRDNARIGALMTKINMIPKYRGVDPHHE